MCFNLFFVSCCPSGVIKLNIMIDINIQKHELSFPASNDAVLDHAPRALNFFNTSTKTEEV
jgi:hypothetical protein